MFMSLSRFSLVLFPGCFPPKWHCQKVPTPLDGEGGTDYRYLMSVADPDPFDTDPVLLFNLILIRILLFDADPNRFKEVMYLKQYYLHILT
jgi:hypothetical protein